MTTAETIRSEKPIRYARLLLMAEIYEYENGQMVATGEIVHLIDNDKMAAIMQAANSEQYVIIQQNC